MNNQQQIEQAVTILEKGGIVVFPTDTAFGVGCRLDNNESVEKLFKLRRRPENKATPVLVDTVQMAQNYLQPVPQKVIDTLIEPYWPGALTIVLPCLSEKIPAMARGQGDTLGVRIPNHVTTRAIIRALGIPILGCSANFAGEATPYAMEDLDPEFVNLVDMVVQGECSSGKQASTVIDCSSEPWKVLREGAIKLAL